MAMNDALVVFGFQGGELWFGLDQAPRRVGGLGCRGSFLLGQGVLALQCLGAFLCQGLLACPLALLGTLAGSGLGGLLGLLQRLALLLEFLGAFFVLGFGAGAFDPLGHGEVGWFRL